MLNLVVAEPDPLSNVVLSSACVAALTLAATKRRGPMSTLDILLGVVAADHYGDWSSLQLRATYLSPEDTARFTDPPGDTGATWQRVPLTPAAAEALRVARTLSEDYELVPLPPGLLTLGLLLAPDAAATRALLSESDLSHAELLDLAQDAILGSTLELFHEKYAPEPDRETDGHVTASTERAASLGKPTGWGPDWQLLETPATRRFDLWVKVTVGLEAVLLLALCLQLVTETIGQAGWWAVLLAPLGLWVTFTVGPPKRSPLTSLLRVLLASALDSDVMIATAFLLLVVEAIDYYYLMPRMYAAGTGGSLLSPREVSRVRTAGLREVQRSGGLLNYIPAEVQELISDRSKS